MKKSKNCNTDSIPHTLFYNNEKIRDEQKASTFADFFSHKVSSIITNSTISNNVFNGSKKINCEPSNFMLKENVLECLKDLKIKNCEGYDRIPQRVLADGAEILVNPLHKLFEKIYLQKCIPEQWSIAKVIPIHKKGPKNNIENYRPISNLCSTSKIFEKLILKHLLNISEKQKIDITGKHQHGFKKNRGTASLAIQLQSIIARALDEDNYVAMASLDLSAAFDVVNIDLLIDRLRVLGVPCDMVGLLSIWLRNRFLCRNWQQHICFRPNQFWYNTGINPRTYPVCHIRCTPLQYFKTLKLCGRQLCNYQKQIKIRMHQRNGSKIKDNH